MRNLIYNRHAKRSLKLPAEIIQRSSRFFMALIVLRMPKLNDEGLVNKTFVSSAHQVDEGFQVRVA